MARLRPRCTRLDDEDGTTLVELLVAFSILAVIMSGVAATIVQATSLTREARWREVAANILTSEIERLAQLDPQSITSGPPRVVTTEYGDLTVERDAEWVPANSTADACLAPSDEPRDLLRVTLIATWEGLDRAPTVTNTVFTPAVGTFELDTGHIAVILRDRDNMPPAVRHNVMIRASDGATTTLRATSQGCAFFDHLEPGTYDVEVIAPGYIDGFNSTDLIAVPSPTVIVGTTQSVTFNYDLPTTLRPDYVTDVPFEDAVFPFALLDARASSTDSPLGPLTLENVAPADLEFPDVYPFPAGYTLEIGDNDCELFLATGSGPAEPGDVTLVPVPLETYAISLVDDDGNAVREARPLRLELPADVDACPAGVSLDLGDTSVATGTMDVVLPGGDWRFVLEPDDIDNRQVAAPGLTDGAGTTVVEFSVTPAEPTFFTALDTDGDGEPDRLGTVSDCIDVDGDALLCDAIGDYVQCVGVDTDTSPTSCGEPYQCNETAPIADCTGPIVRPAVTAGNWNCVDSDGDGTPDDCDEPILFCVDTDGDGYAGDASDGGVDNCGTEYTCIVNPFGPPYCATTFGDVYVCVDDQGADPPVVDRCFVDEDLTVEIPFDPDPNDPPGAVPGPGGVSGTVTASPRTYVAIDIDGDGLPGVIGEKILSCIDTDGTDTNYCSIAGAYVYCVGDDVDDAGDVDNCGDPYYCPTPSTNVADCTPEFFEGATSGENCIDSDGDGTLDECGGTLFCVDGSLDGNVEACGTQYTCIDIDGVGGHDECAAEFGATYACTDDEGDDPPTIDSCVDGGANPVAFDTDTTDGPLAGTAGPGGGQFSPGGFV